MKFGILNAKLINNLIINIRVYLSVLHYGKEAS